MSKLYILTLLSAIKKTMETYARMDLTSRKLAEEWQDEEDFRQKDLVLLYARKLDKKTTKARKLLETSMLSSDPWDFYHGRIMLVYRVFNGSGNRRDAYGSSYDNSDEPSGLRDTPRRSGPGPNGDDGPDLPQPIAPAPWTARSVPVYPKISRQYVLPETLDHYGLPWGYDPADPNYIMIWREMDQRDMEVLFEHTQRLHARRAQYEPGSGPDWPQPTSFDNYSRTSAWGDPYISGSSGTAPIPVIDEYKGIYSEDNQDSRAPFRTRSSFGLPHSPPPPPPPPPLWSGSPGPRQEATWHQDSSRPRASVFLTAESLPAGVGRKRSQPAHRPRRYEAPYSNTGTHNKGEKHLSGEKQAATDQSQERQRTPWRTGRTEAERAAYDWEKIEKEKVGLKHEAREHETGSARHRGGNLTAQKIAEMAVASRSRSHSRSHARVKFEPRDRTRTLETKGELPTSLRHVSGGAATAFVPRSPSRRPTYEYPQVGTIMEEEMIGTGSTRRSPARGSTDSYSGRGILKVSDTDYRLTEGTSTGARAPPLHRARVDDDSPSDMYLSDGSESDTLSETDDSEPERTPSEIGARSAEASLLGLDRTLTDSPQSMSSGARSASERNAASRVTSKGKGSTTRLRRVTASISSIDPPYGEAEESRVIETEAQQAVRTSDRPTPIAESSGRAQARNEHADREPYYEDEESGGENAEATRQLDQDNDLSLYE
ncbi:hypothetical protein LTR85_010313 [Meristemomyces frigidus]|nr:hypothetical protein LTR85_010313 [Meristemomyces frigidus]